MGERIAVIGLGYVGLPVAVAFAEKHASVVAYDIDEARVEELRQRRDRNGDIPSEALLGCEKIFTSKPNDLGSATFYVVTVPTPIDKNRRPDLGPIIKACELIGTHLKRGDVVVLESTVYPGVTEDVLGSALARISGLAQNVDFSVGYSPERINPGDSEHTFAAITKIISAQDEATLDRLAAVYGPVVDAGLHYAPSIKTAEAAKVIENTQRDLNVALMNELALICDKLDIRTTDVLEAAGTKWNFMPFTPGLVGGHCIGVDPYYLTSRAEQAGYYPQVILAGRRINDSMGVHIATKLASLLTAAGKELEKSRVGILGLSFKENVSDLRNSRVPDIVVKLTEFGIKPLVHDPLADSKEALTRYGIELRGLDAMCALDGLVLAVPHVSYLELGFLHLCTFLASDSVLIDVKSALDPGELPSGVTYWSL